MRHHSRTIDLNADLGEGCPNDEAILQIVTSASISCGAHAGEPAGIEHTLRHAATRGIIIGAHPGYSDREGFGRRERQTSADEVETLILDQVAFLARLAGSVGARIQFVKPHGALYNQAQRDATVARGVIAAAVHLGLPVLGQPGSTLEALAAEAGSRYIAEGFPDRRYQADGRLVPRSDPRAVLDDPAELEAQVVRLAESSVETLCIHGDDPRAVANATLVRSLLNRNGIALKGFV